MHLGEKMSVDWKNSICWQCPASLLQGSPCMQWDDPQRLPSLERLLVQTYSGENASPAGSAI